MLHLSVVDISKRISDSFALSHISFSQNSGQKIAVSGETGSGKSTLLRIVAGLLQPDEGKVLLAGERVMGPDEQLIPGHPQIAYLSQTHDLRNNYRIEELLEYANRLPDGEAEKLYRICRIDHLLKRKNVQLSGGEKQRVALTRLLVGAPSLLLLDEPFSNLDPIHKQLLRTVLDEISTRLGITCILTSHDPSDTLAWADNIIMLRNGQVIQEADPETMYHHPVNEYVAGMFGPYMLFTPEQASRLDVTLSAGQQLLVRPNGFVGAGDGIQVTITERSFLGAYHFLRAVSTDGLELVLLSAGGGIGPGHELSVRLATYSII